MADRDIIPENDGGEIKIHENGRGFTNVVQSYLNKSSLPSGLIEDNLLNSLNNIFHPDTSFSEIRVRQHEGGAWEIYLEEEKKGRIALSQSGSGLKTILLVLGFLVITPHIEKRALSNYVFAFEELENNLHPALQRRLMSYIRDTSVKEGCLVFLTTHSNAVIDLLSHDRNSQIVHVTHDGDVARARHVQTYVDNRGILDDLDVRASDLLQANGVVWVEGPSDRLYFNRWMELITGEQLQEGSHYQCVFYGGRLLAHLSGAAPFDSADVDEVVRILRVNRNAIVLIDSDKKSAASIVNATKARIAKEVEGLDGIAWITQGREVEN